MSVRMVFRSQLQPAPRDASRRTVRLHRTRPVARPRRRLALRLWLPLTPLWILLAPFALLLAPLLLATCAGRRLRPLPALWALGGVLFALSGTVIDVDSPRATIRLRIL
jgi:hypothetical protein